MFLHEFIYECKTVLRQKEELFWVMIFPLALGTMFYFAFGNLTNSTENFHTIPVAVCAETNAKDDNFKQVLEMLSKEGEPPLIGITDTNWEDAVDLLEENKVRGIFKIEDEISLSCLPSDSFGADGTLPIEQSILEAILREYRTNIKTITEITAADLTKLPEIIPLMETSVSYAKNLSLTPGNMDTIIQYYFNLIAMACLFTSFAGAQIAIKNQANLSALGARKCVSPNRKFLSVAAQFLACLLTQFICIIINILYLYYVLKIEFGTSLPMILFTAFIGCIMGIGFGFFIGSIGQLKETTKTGIMVSASLLCCFLSGLMIGDMRTLIEEHCPVINDINPAVLISDSFLTLNIYGTTERYFFNLGGLLLFAVLFTFAGCLIIRRKTYASL